MKILPKLCGADIELGNFITGRESDRGTGGDASVALLSEMPGLPTQESWTYSGYWHSNMQDRGRRFLLENGSSAYIDLNHLEIALPEVRSAYDHVACCHAMLRMVRRAQARANAKLPKGEHLHVLVNNTDGLGNSYGSHLNFLMPRKTWDNLFQRKPHHLLFQASYQVSSIILTGQGKVGAEDGMPKVPYQISQRADFIECLLGEQTTIHRPIMNCRDEPLCGPRWRGLDVDSPGKRLARLHVIFYDNSLCHVASLLRVGMTQLMLCLLETGNIDPSLMLDDPVPALWRWSRDPDLQARAELITKQQVTAVELQRKFWEQVAPLVESGECDEAVPGAKDIHQLWGGTLTLLEARDFGKLAGRLDWVLKRAIIERAMSQRPGLSWDSPEIKHLDHSYSSLEDGLYWAMEDAGVVERVVPEERILHFETEPPDDTRAWTRAMLLRMAGPKTISKVDWDSIEVQVPDKTMWPRYRTLEMADPLSFTRRQTEFLFDGSRPLDEVLDCLGATDVSSNTFTWQPTNNLPSVIVPGSYEIKKYGGST